jgi:uncharacterized protein YhjY with autotransporter beta-barrel domain
MRENNMERRYTTRSRANPVGASVRRKIRADRALSCGVAVSCLTALHPTQGHAQVATADNLYNYLFIVTSSAACGNPNAAPAVGAACGLAGNLENAPPGGPAGGGGSSGGGGPGTINYANVAILNNVIPVQLNVENSLFKSFSGTQLQELANRLTAIRNGANGFQLSGVPGGGNPDSSLFAVNNPALGGGASADDVPSGYGRWGGFMNAAYDWGQRELTQTSDAFKSHSYELTAGADYRVSRGLVIGGILGYTNSSVSFDDPANAAGGSVDTQGYSALVYLQQEWRSAYFSVSIGDQVLSQSMVRQGIFTNPSDNGTANYTALSSTNGNSLLGTLSLGYDLSAGAAQFEPYLNLQYRHTSIDAFSEHGASGTDSMGGSFDIDQHIDNQSLPSEEGKLGVKLQYALKPSFGVVVPYVDARYVHEFSQKTYNITGTFVSLYGLVPNYLLPADRPTQNFGELAGGVSVVAPGGVQFYLSYLDLIGQQYTKNEAIQAGFRLEL